MIWSFSRITPRILGMAIMSAGLFLSSIAHGEGKIVVQADKPGARFAPTFYGLMTEEINFSYDGGLYGELIQNRAFKNAPRRINRPGTAPTTEPAPSGIPHWAIVHSASASGEISLDTENPVNGTLTTSLKLNINAVPPGERVGVANDGFWGIPVKPDATYTASFYAKASNGFTGPLTLSIESTDGRTIHATAKIDAISDQWKRYVLTLQTGKLSPSANNQFVVSGQSKGTINLNLVSLFPPTYKPRDAAALGGRPVTGFRPDIMQLLAEMKPAFLRFPGGNYVEGSDFANRFDFKTTIGPWEERPTHMSPWGYRSSDGLGLLEFLEWCEELNMEPVLAVYAGLNLDGGRDLKTGDALKPLIQDALDEIEYVSGDASTTWGARRAKNGHPAPFKLQYVEIGNEDWLHNGAASYRGPNGRFAMFYNAIKDKYPGLQIIATTNPGPDVKVDVIDNHHYMAPVVAIRNAHLYDNADRNGPKIFEGEWASQEFRPRENPRPYTPTFECALSDAAFLTGLERNADIVIMSCYAPLFTRMNPGGNQWRTNLIGYDTLNSFGSPPYYVQKMFSQARGDVVLPIASITPDVIPVLPPTTQPAAPTTATSRPGRPGARRQVPPPNPNEPLFASASREDATGDIIVKVVNVFDARQTVTLELSGVTVMKSATIETMSAQPGDTNLLESPTNVVPRIDSIDSASSSWSHTFTGNSVNVIRFKTARPVAK